MKHAAILACACALLLFVRPSAQVPQATQTQKPRATGLILGRVMDGLSTRPVPGASVTIALRTAAAAGPFAPQSVITGSDGYFLFHDLPKGEFSLLASAVGYLVSDGVGVNHPGGSSQRVLLGEGERLNGVSVRLWRTGVVTGQLTDEHGEAVEGITVTLFKTDGGGGRRRLATFAKAVTDDRGVYRFASLKPGEYALCAMFTRQLGNLSAAMSASDQAQRFAGGSDAPSNAGSGYRIGNSVLISSSGGRNVDPAPDETGRQLVFADACHPGGIGLAGAEPITVDSGETKGGVDLLLRLMPAAKISGVVMAPFGPVPGMGVHLVPAETPDIGFGAGIEASAAITTADGRFEFISVPPGSYVLKVMYVPPAQNPPNGRSGLGRGSAPAPPAPSLEPVLWAAQPITTGSADVGGISLNLREGTRITGRVVYEGAAPKPSRGIPNVEVQCTTSPGGSSSDGQDQREGAPVRPDDTFVVPGLVPGVYQCHLNGVAPPPWSLKAILIQNRDVTLEGFELGATDVTGAQLVFTDQPSGLSGVVHAAGGAVDPNALVVVFPQNRARWTDPFAPSRQQVTARTSQSGMFAFPNLPPGDYFVAAVDDRLSLRWQDPSVLNQLAADASRITIAEGEKRALNLTSRAR